MFSVNDLDQWLNRLPATLRQFLIILSLTLFFIILVGGYSYLQQREKRSPLAHGVRIPPAIVSSTGRQMVQLDTLVSANSVFLFFTASCVSCRVELEEWQEVLSGAGDTVRLVPISLSDGPMTEVLLAELDFTAPVYIDDFHQARELYQITSVPFLYFVDREKVVRWATHGLHNRSALIKMIRRVFNSERE